MRNTRQLIETLRAASSNAEAHAEAQESYFLPGDEAAPLAHCGTSCCIAGDAAWVAYNEAHENPATSMEQVENWVLHSHKSIWAFAKNYYDLNSLESKLAFSESTTAIIHSALADLFEAGYRLKRSPIEGLNNGAWGYTSDKFSFVVYSDGLVRKVTEKSLNDFLEEYKVKFVP